MLSYFVGEYDLEKDTADVWAVFWSKVHAMDYAAHIDRILSDGRVLWLCDDSGRIEFYSDGADGSGKSWARYEKAVARDIAGNHPLSAWSDHGVKAGKAVVLGAIREAVEAVA